MAYQPLIRPGGRSERIQKAVHQAVKDLILEIGEGNLSIPLVAEKAEVTPSTIYRRWTSLPDLIAAVASESFHSDNPPPDTGSFEEDLRQWVRQIVDDISSGPGRALLHERIGNVAIARQAAGYAYVNLKILTDQAVARGERVHDPERLMDLVFAPIVYRIAFAGQNITPEFQDGLISTALSLEPLPPAKGQSSFADYVVYR